MSASNWEHLQNVLMQVHNRIVREDFSDLPNEDEPGWTDAARTPRGNLKRACLVYDTDSAIIALNRLFLFYITLRKGVDLHPPIYSIPTERYQASVKFAPQVTLYFREDLDDVEPGYSPIDAEISFRVTHETTETFTEAEAKVLANRIKDELAPSNGYRWQKGRTKLAYRDKEKGYLFSVNAFSEAEGRQTIGKILAINGDTLDNDKLTIAHLATAPPIVPPPLTVLGKVRREPRRRPVGWVRFRYAELHLWGHPKAVTLIDLSRRRRGALVEP